MTERTLTQEEKERLLKPYLNKFNIHPRDLLLFIYVLLISVAFSGIISVIFFSTAYFWHHETLNRSLQAALYALLTGPGVVLLITFIILIQSIIRKDPFADIKQEINEGICQIRMYKALKLYKLVDEGNFDNPDYLAVTDKNKIIAIPAYEITDKHNIKSNVEIAFLPKSKITVNITFSGEVINMEKEIIETDNLWRNDELPFCVPIVIEKLPQNAKEILQPN